MIAVSSKKITVVLVALAALLCMLAACTAAPAVGVTYAPQQAQASITPTATPLFSSVEAPAISSSPTAQPAVPPSAQPTPTAASYEAYLGNWISSDTAKTRSEVYDQGGSAIQFTAITGNHAVGNIISVSESYGHHDASVDFDGLIDDGGVLVINFDNDGWDNYGTISIVFQEDSLFVRMQSIATDEYANWDIGNGDYGFIRES